MTRWVAMVALMGCSFSPTPPDDIDSDADIGPGFAQRRTIIVSTIDVGDVTEDIVVPVVLNSDAAFASVASRGGEDILFRQGNANLAHDIERLDALEGQLIAWVRLPAFAPGQDSFELFYGDGNIAPSTGNAWTGLADLVYHFEGGPALRDHSPTDATSSQVGLDNLIPGVVGAAYELAPVPIVLDDSVVADRSNESFSLGFWFFQEAFNGIDATLWAKGAEGEPGYRIRANGPSWTAEVFDEIGGVAQASFGSLGVDGRATYLMMVVDRESDELRTYVDGSFVDAANIGMLGPLSAPTRAATIGGSPGIDGWIDELRAYRGAMTPQWIAIDHSLTEDRLSVTVSPPTDTTYPR